MKNSTNDKITSAYDDKLKQLIDIRDCRSKKSVSIKTLHEKENELKNQLAEYVRKNSPILLDTGRVEYKYNIIKKTFKRKDTLAYIRKTYGDEIADDVDKNCTESNISEGVYTYTAKARKNVDVDDAGNLESDIIDSDNNK